MEQARLIIAIALSVLIFLVWDHFFMPKTPPPPTGAVARTEAQGGDAKAPSPAEAPVKPPEMTQAPATAAPSSSGYLAGLAADLRASIAAANAPSALAGMGEALAAACPYVERWFGESNFHHAEFGDLRRLVQLKEKQKAKAIYGILERQFSNYFDKASRTGGNTAESLVRFLELRLDNAIYRLGWARTRRQARQIVGHGFIQVNGKRVDIPSFSVSIGDVITIKPSKLEKGIVKKIPEAMNQSTLPSWISRDEKAMTGKVTALPEGEDLKQDFDPTLIVEFYSR